MSELREKIEQFLEENAEASFNEFVEYIATSEKISTKLAEMIILELA